MRHRHLPPLVGLVSLVLIASSIPASASPFAATWKHKIRPTAILVGGNLAENADILSAIVAKADPDGAGPAKARIAIVTAASRGAATPEEAADDELNNAAANGLYYSQLFQRFGAETYAVPIDGAVDYDGDAYTPARASDPAVAAEVLASTGIFFGGGDQMRYVRTLQLCEDAEQEAFTTCIDTPVLSALRTVADRGVVSGVSAGLTIQQGADMITGGESYEAWRDGATAGYLDDASELGYLPAGGFGFLDSVLLDSHFATWGRQGRAVKLALETGHRLVLGVDETTAVVVDRHTQHAKVIGVNGASLLDLRFARSNADGVEGVRWSYLTAGDTLNLRAGLTRRAPGSTPVSPVASAVASVEDIWDSPEGAGTEYTHRDLGRAVASSTSREASGTSEETEPQFTTSLRRDRFTQAWTTPSGVISFSNVKLAIRSAE
ncbi:cyanophycinase [Rhodoglobus vestalii]|uniref:Cyanophycinase n=1 Tax=Rhodoglobus vestalii TaxID=193384 RepID=A0A8H2K6X9_9MICO|nr:cyanophycinase [Rhodoglobus vestalii]TQO18806.1 cyanophycinase [Rhodoglobus vestalii]